MTTLFISDLHLNETRPQVTEAFFSFLRSLRSEASALYILGDLFDAWIGDDDDRALVADVAAALAALAQSGTQVYFQHGNRDFLLGEAYARRSGMQLLPELAVIERGGEHWLLAHGDQFCTRDAAYQQFRQQVRQTRWQEEILAKSLTERRQLAAALREKSREANSLKAEDIMDVTPDVVMQALQEKACRKLIHGHTHRPARHTDANGLERLVLGEWDKQFWYLQERDGMLQLIERKIG